VAQVTSTMTWDPWQPSPYAAADEGPALMHGVVVNHYTGELEGTGDQQVLITLWPGGTSTFTAYERVNGRIGDRTGSFVLQLSGSTGGGTAKADLTVLPDSGTGALRGARGGGTYFCDNPGPDGNSSVTLELNFE
jgi:hypothetical protein